MAKTKNTPELTQKANVFQLSWDWYDSYSHTLFIHDNKTQKQFDKDVVTLLKKYGQEYLKKETGWASAVRWIEFIGTKLNELGYREVNPVGKTYFGAYIIGDKDKDWAKVIGKDLFTKALAHNKKVAKRINVSAQ